MHRIKKVTAFKVTTALLCLIFVGFYALLTTGCSTGATNINDLPPALQKEPVKKYVMKQKIWTLGDTFVIKDETQKPVFFVKGKFFSIGDKLSFRDEIGKELAYISQKVFSFKPRYKIYRDKDLAADVVKKITLFKDRYIVDIPGADDYKVSGNFWKYEYTFTRKGKTVAFVSKKLFSWSDTYGIAIVPGEDDVLILAAAIVIDMISHGSEHHQNINTITLNNLRCQEN